MRQQSHRNPRRKSKLIAFLGPIFIIFPYLKKHTSSRSVLIARGKLINSKRITVKKALFLNKFTTRVTCQI